MISSRATLPRALVLLAGLTALAPPAGARDIVDLLRSGHALVPDGKLYYDASGGGQTVLLIGGGTGMDLREWDDQLLPIGRRFGLVRTDPRGLGKSSPATAAYAPHDDVLALLDYLHIERAHLVGGSFAGKVAIDFAIAHPDRVRSLVLIAPEVSGYEFPKAVRDRQAALLAIIEKSGAKAYADAVVHDDFLVPAGSLRFRHAARTLLEENADRLPASLRWARSLDPPAFPRLGEIRVPTLLVVGEYDHPESRKLVDLLAGKIAGSKLVVMSKSGHTVYMERFRAFNRLVLEFLDDVSRR